MKHSKISQEILWHETLESQPTDGARFISQFLHKFQPNVYAIVLNISIFKWNTQGKKFVSTQK